MLIALDFDKTYELNPMMFDEIIITLQDFGNTVILATYRHPEFDRHPLLDELTEVMGVPVYYTDGKAKKPFLEALGAKVDIWIDDNPLSITQDSAWAPNSPELHAWREEQKVKLSA